MTNLTYTLSKYLINQETEKRNITGHCGSHGVIEIRNSVSQVQQTSRSKEPPELTSQEDTT